jgi:predicted Zn-dependent protease
MTPARKACFMGKIRPVKISTRILVSLALLLLIVGAPPADAFRKSRVSHNEHTPGAEEQIDRLRDIMVPLLRVTNRRMAPDDVRVAIIDDPAINAASAGDGKYYVTTGLLNQATDDQLRGVLAHEIAHEDLGHPSQAQVVGAGVGIGVALLEQLIPGSSAVTPLAGTMITNSYTRPLEIQADRHAITLLQRAGYSKETMVDTLTWLARRNGDSGGGLLSTHPATSERIQALRALR